FLAASHERFAERDPLAPAPEPDRTRLRATIAAEDELLAASERVSVVPGLRWEVYRDDFPGATGVPAALQAGGARVRDFLWERLRLTANSTHPRARDTGEVTFLRGKQLPGRPADEAFARLELAWSPAHPLPLAPRLWPGRIFYEANVIADNFLDRANVRQVGSRVLHDVGLELALPLGGVRLSLEAKNAGDDRTRDALGFPLPGRAVFATLSYGRG